MDIHGQIMNIQVTKENYDKAYTKCVKFFKIDAKWLAVHLAYKLGHRDARNEAAELVFKKEKVYKDFIRLIMTPDYGAERIETVIKSLENKEV